MRVDSYTADIIREYIQDVQTELGRNSSKTFPYGAGTLELVAKRIEALAQAEGYSFYKQHKLNRPALKVRIMSYANGRNVVSASYEDARWLAQTIKKYRKKKDATPAPQPAPIEQAPPPSNNIDDILKLAKYLREYPSFDDEDLFAITTQAEVKVLRLLVDRLEK